jgi:hypothetical protein
MGIVSEKLRASAKGKNCTFAIPGICDHGTETVVLCHVRDETKGLGNKSNDYSAAFGCYHCHTAVDQHLLPLVDELFYTLRAVLRTWAIWIERGLIVLPVDPETAKHRPGKKWRKPQPVRPGVTLKAPLPQPRLYRPLEETR